MAFVPAYQRLRLEIAERRQDALLHGVEHAQEDAPERVAERYLDRHEAKK